MVSRFGISQGVSPRESFEKVGEIAKAVEAHGFEVLWFVDHQLGMKDVYTAMNVAALATEKIQIGSAVTNLQTRHPTVTANATTALDELSNGRAMLGIGAGWVAVHSIGKSPNKLGEMRQGIAEFRQLFSGKQAELYGTQVRLATARRQIPVYLAVSQPGMLRLAGEACDGAILMGAADPDFCQWQLDYIYQGLEKGGHSRNEIVIDLIVTMSTDDDKQKALNDVRASYHYEDHLSLRAEHKQIVSDEFVQSVAIAGDVETCVARLQEVAALDIDRITFALLSGGRLRRLEALATEVIPRMRAD
jgi:5,10-methylenetetrahydromethanopterin reductase